MNRIMPCMAAHPPLGEEVVTVDEVDTCVGHDSVDNTAEEQERMSKQ
jgi:hypothetical protein